VEDLVAEVFLDPETSGVGLRAILRCCRKASTFSNAEGPPGDAYGAVDVPKTVPRDDLEARNALLALESAISASRSV